MNALTQTELSEEYISRFALRQLVEEWLTRAGVECPEDPYQYLIDEATEQRRSGGGIVTCPNHWCRMTMPASQITEHQKICNDTANWVRCVRCNLRVDVTKMSQHRMFCKLEHCALCGEMLLPRMLPMCPFKKVAKAERDLQAATHRREKREKHAAALAAARGEGDTAVAAVASGYSDLLSPGSTSTAKLATPTAPELTRVPLAQAQPLATTSFPVMKSPLDIDVMSTTAGAAGAEITPIMLASSVASSLSRKASPATQPLAFSLEEKHNTGNGPKTASPTSVVIIVPDNDISAGAYTNNNKGGGSGNLADGDPATWYKGLGTSSTVSVSHNNNNSSDSVIPRPSFPALHAADMALREKLEQYPEDALSALVVIQGIWRRNMSLHLFREQVFSGVWQRLDSAQEGTTGTHKENPAAFRAVDSNLRAGGARAAAGESEGNVEGGKDVDQGGTPVEKVEVDCDSAEDSMMDDEVCADDVPVPSFEETPVYVSDVPLRYGAYMTQHDLDNLTKHCHVREVLQFSVVLKIVRAATKILRDRPLVQHIAIPVNASLVVVGDLHGQMKDLEYIITNMGVPTAERYYLFNGDFIDRGPYGCEVLVYIYSLLCTYPRYVYLNRGNHENYATNTEYGFMAELYAKYPRRAPYLLDAMTNSYEVMPLMSIVDHRVAVVHGGVPRFECQLDEIDAIGHVRDIPVAQQTTRAEQLLAELLWNDPVEKFRSRQLGMNHQGDGWRTSSRGCGVEYLTNITEQFLKKNDLKLLIRSHDVKSAGFELVHKDKSITVFSASNYGGVSGNRGAVAVLTKESEQPVFHTWFLKEDYREHQSNGFLDGDIDGFLQDGRSRNGEVEDDGAGNNSSGTMNGRTNTGAGGQPKRFNAVAVAESTLLDGDEYICGYYITDGGVLDDDDAISDTSSYTSANSDNADASRTTCEDGAARSANSRSRTSPTRANEGSTQRWPTGGGSGMSGSRLTSHASRDGKGSMGMSPSSGNLGSVRVGCGLAQDSSIVSQLQTLQQIRELVYFQRYALLAAFNQVDEMHTGTVYKAEWCVVMREVLKLDIPWYYICQFLTPRLEVDGVPSVEYMRFLRHFDVCFALDFRLSWQKATVLRLSSGLDLPEDVINAFCDRRSLNFGDSGIRFAPRRNSHNNGLTTLVSPFSTPMDSPGRSAANNNNESSLPVDGRGVNSVTEEDDDWWQHVQLDFKTFALKGRALSPAVAAMEDNEIFALFCFFDVNMQGHVYVGDVVVSIAAVVEEAEGSEDEAELLFSGEIDFTTVQTGTRGGGQFHSASTSSFNASSSSSSDSDSDSRPPKQQEPLKGGMLGGLGGLGGNAKPRLMRPPSSSSADDASDATDSNARRDDRGKNAASVHSLEADNADAASKTEDNTSFSLGGGPSEEDSAGNTGNPTTASDSDDGPATLKRRATLQSHGHPLPPPRQEPPRHFHRRGSNDSVAASYHTGSARNLKTEAETNPLTSQDAAPPHRLGAYSSNVASLSPVGVLPLDYDDDESDINCGDLTAPPEHVSRSSRENSTAPSARAMAAESSGTSSGASTVTTPTSTSAIGTVATVISAATPKQGATAAATAAEKRNHCSPGSGSSGGDDDDDDHGSSVLSGSDNGGLSRAGRVGILTGIPSHSMKRMAHCQSTTNKISTNNTNGSNKLADFAACGSSNVSVSAMTVAESAPFAANSNAATSNNVKSSTATLSENGACEMGSGGPAGRQTLLQRLNRRLAMPAWIYPTLLRVQAQLLGSYLRLRFLFQALNRSHTGHLTEAEFLPLMEFMNCLLEHSLTPEQAHQLFLCVHDSAIHYVQSVRNRRRQRSAALYGEMNEPRFARQATATTTTTAAEAAAAEAARGDGFLNSGGLGSTPATPAEPCIDWYAYVRHRQHAEQQRGERYILLAEFLAFFCVKPIPFEDEVDAMAELLSCTQVGVPVAVATAPDIGLGSTGASGSFVSRGLSPDAEGEPDPVPAEENPSDAVSVSVGRDADREGGPGSFKKRQQQHQQQPERHAAHAGKSSDMDREGLPSLSHHGVVSVVMGADEQPESSRKDDNYVLGSRRRIPSRRKRDSAAGSIIPEESPTRISTATTATSTHTRSSRNRQSQAASLLTSNASSGASVPVSDFTTVTTTAAGTATATGPSPSPHGSIDVFTTLAALGDTYGENITVLELLQCLRARPLPPPRKGQQQHRLQQLPLVLGANGVPPLASMPADHFNVSNNASHSESLNWAAKVSHGQQQRRAQQAPQHPHPHQPLSPQRASRGSNLAQHSHHPNAHPHQQPQQRTHDSTLSIATPSANAISYSSFPLTTVEASNMAAVGPAADSSYTLHNSGSHHRDASGSIALPNADLSSSSPPTQSSKSAKAASRNASVAPVPRVPNPPAVRSQQASKGASGLLSRQRTPSLLETSIASISARPYMLNQAVEQRVTVVNTMMYGPPGMYLSSPGVATANPMLSTVLLSNNASSASVLDEVSMRSASDVRRSPVGTHGLLINNNTSGMRQRTRKGGNDAPYSSSLAALATPSHTHHHNTSLVGDGRSALTSFSMPSPPPQQQQQQQLHYSQHHSQPHVARPGVQLSGVGAQQLDLSLNSTVHPMTDAVGSVSPVTSANGSTPGAAGAPRQLHVLHHVHHPHETQPAPTAAAESGAAGNDVASRKQKPPMLPPSPAAVSPRFSPRAAEPTLLPVQRLLSDMGNTAEDSALPPPATATAATTTSTSKDEPFSRAKMKLNTFIAEAHTIHPPPATTATTATEAAESKVSPKSHVKSESGGPMENSTSFADSGAPLSYTSTVVPPEHSNINSNGSATTVGGVLPRLSHDHQASTEPSRAADGVTNTPRKRRSGNGSAACQRTTAEFLVMLPPTVEGPAGTGADGGCASMTSALTSPNMGTEGLDTAGSSATDQSTGGSRTISTSRSGTNPNSSSRHPPNTNGGKVVKMRRRCGTTIGTCKESAANKERQLQDTAGHSISPHALPAIERDLTHASGGAGTYSRNHNGTGRCSQSPVGTPMNDSLANSGLSSVRPPLGPLPSSSELSKVFPSGTEGGRVAPTGSTAGATTTSTSNSNGAAVTAAAPGDANAREKRTTAQNSSRSTAKMREDEKRGKMKGSHVLSSQSHHRGPILSPIPRAAEM